MNRNCHRVVFNQRRGQLMAVAETALASGKSKPGESSGLNKPTLGWARTAAAALCLATGVWPVSWAQIIADPTAPANQRPTVLRDSAGRPLVNIQTPSAAGLSRNTYRQFDVPTSGIVLNNATSNPWLSNGNVARTILNEVNSTKRSFINGAITVNGAAAQVIVANPNGITVNGGSFVNASRATLSTGLPQVTNGALTGFQVFKGSIIIAAGGLNSSATPFTDLMSSWVTVAGQLRAQNLGITTGEQTVANDTGLISNQNTNTNTYGAGDMSIVTTALGGMYANNISILATGAGFGVRNQGTWQAGGGQIVVTADGFVVNMGSVAAGVVSLATVQGNIENVGSLQGSQAVALNAGGDVSVFGTGLRQSAGSTVLISAKGAVNVFNTASHGAAQISSTAAGGQVSISAGKDIVLQTGTSVAAHKDVQLSSDAMVLASNASINSSTGQVTALAGNGIGLAGATVTGRQVHLETGAAFQDSIASMVVRGGSVRGDNQTTLLSAGAIQISSSGVPVVSGGSNVHVQANGALEIAAGSTLSAGQHMSVMAGTTNVLQAVSGTTATNGQKVALSAGGNMLVSGNSVTATGASLSSGQDLSIEANDGNANLQALSNAGGASVDRVILSAGKDLNVSAFKGSLWASGLQASGENINLLSNGTTSVAHATVRNGSTTQPSTQAVASTLTAREDLTVGSINATAGTSSQVQLVASSLNAGGRARVLSNGVALLTAATDTVNGVNSSARSSITAGSVAIQGGTVQTDAANIRTNGNKSSPNRSGDLTVTATTGDAIFNVHTGIRSQFNSTGNMALHANGNLTHWHTQANAGGGLSSTSATGQINGTGANLVAADVLSFASKGAQTHSSGFYSGGSASVFNETGHLALNSTRVQAVGIASVLAYDQRRSAWNNFVGPRLREDTGPGFDARVESLRSVSGQTSIESGGTLGVDASSVLMGTTDLSIMQGQGDITLNPAGWGRGTLAMSQIGYGRNLTLATRNGSMNFSGADGSNGIGSSQRVFITTPGSLTLAANNINLRGSELRANSGVINLTATTGSLTMSANKVTQWSAGFTNTYWDQAQLVASMGIDARAAGDMSLDGVFASTAGRANFQSGGHLTTSGKVNHWRVDNRPSAGSSFNGWYQDEEWVNYTSLTGASGITLGAMGGNLRINGTNVSGGGSGTATLQALGHVRLESVMTDRVNNATTTGWRENCVLFVCRKTTWTTFHDRAWRNVNAASVNARDISIKAGNNVETYATQLNASNNLKIEAGDQALYHAVKNDTDHHDTTHKKSSFIGIRYDKSTEHSTTRISTPVVTHLYANGGNLTSYSGGDQLFQGTVANYYSRDIQAGVGERARADARIILEGVRTTVFQQRTKESNYVVWQRQINQGSNTETLTLPSFTGTINTPFRAPGGITVQIPAGEFRSQIATLSQQPGMAYLNELAARTDVNWQPVKLAHEQWNFKQEGLTPAGAALVAVAVAWAMGPGGAGIIGNATTTAGMMGNAALASLGSQAAITLINNKGDVGKTLKELGSSQTVKATIAAALTAGVLDQLGATSTMKELSRQTGFSEKLTYNLINASGRALTNTAINGGNLEDALRQALIGGLVDTAHGQAASKIGQSSLEYVSHKLAHALAGCIAGAAASGTCRDGAIGGAVGEIVAEMFKGKAPAWNASEAEWSTFDAQMKAYGKLVAGAVSAYSGGNAQTAITTAEVAIDNNSRLTMRQMAAMRDMKPPQLQAWMRAQSLIQAITANGGQVPSTMTALGARVNYTQSDVTRLEMQLRGVSPHHQLIFSQPSATLSPLPYSYVNPQTMLNMHNVPGATNTNAFGFPSGGNPFFRELLRTQPQMYSSQNRTDVLLGRNPTVDAQWVQHNPTHRAFMGETLVHHHVNQSHIAVAIPTSVHRTWYSTLHPYR